MRTKKLAREGSLVLRVMRAMGSTAVAVSVIPPLGAT